MAISGHSPTRMLDRYTHPTESLKADALGSFNLSPAITKRSQPSESVDTALSDVKEL
jgi:hypothetical protein